MPRVDTFKVLTRDNAAMSYDATPDATLPDDGIAPPLTPPLSHAVNAR